MLRLVLIATLWMGNLGVASASEFSLLPASATLDGPHSTQRFLVEQKDGDAFTGDRTADAKLTIDNPRVARIDSEGSVVPVGDGQAILKATVDGRELRANLTVKRSMANEPWSFRNHVEAVLTRAGCNSGACHGAAAGKNGLRLSLRAYAPETDFDVLTRQAQGRRIMPTAPAESLLLLKPTGALEHGGGVRFAANSREYRVLADWISAGTPAPKSDDPRVVSLKVFPEAVVLPKSQTQQLLVQAVYSDGRIEDVTRWAKFHGTDDSVAKVDETGRVRVEGHGEAAVGVWYASLVRTATITSPYDLKIDPTVYRDAPRRNPIDEINLRKLEALHVPPAPDAGDAAFLRRAYLDATGTLPPVDTVSAFLLDKNPEKRAALVDQLLRRSEYVDYWAYKWSDVLLVSTQKLPKPAMWAFYRFVRSSVAENMPWDQFARAIVTARGGSLKNGAANYFALHRDPIDLTESTSVAFLGLSLTCARCHNHPLEKWTQNQYYGMAALFARVQLKDGDAPGDVVVMPGASGEIRHPRTGVAVAPQPLDGVSQPLDAPGDRRQAFADWLVAPENPFFARAVVNRVWRNFFGRGLIDPEDDLRATNPASDPALLDWLVHDFRAHGYDLKHVIRTIMTSAAYARASVPAQGDASDSKFLSRYAVKRLPAEVLLDAISQVSSVPSTFAGFPNGWRSLQLPDSKVDSAFLTSFGRPERLATCSCERSSEPSMAQALHLANGTTINEKLRAPNGAVAQALASNASDAQIVERLFLASLSRRPTPGEDERLRATLAAAVKDVSDPKARAEARRQAIEDLYWAVLTGNEFLFNH